jgi:hypothetical protein
VCPGAAAQPVARLEEERGGPTQSRLASGRDAREPTADDDDVVHGRRIYRLAFGIGAQASASSARVLDTDVIAWKDIVRIEADRIVVRDSAADG